MARDRAGPTMRVTERQVSRSFIQQFYCLSALMISCKYTTAPALPRQYWISYSNAESGNLQIDNVGGRLTLREILCIYTHIHTHALFLIYHSHNFGIAEVKYSLTLNMTTSDHIKID